MYVVKRDGRKEEVHFDKITARIRNLTEGLDKRFIDPVRTPPLLRCCYCLWSRARTRLRTHTHTPSTFCRWRWP